LLVYYGIIKNKNYQIQIPTLKGWGTGRRDKNSFFLMGGRLGEGVRTLLSLWAGSGAKWQKLLYPYGWGAGRRGAVYKF